MPEPASVLMFTSARTAFGMLTWAVDFGQPKRAAVGESAEELATRHLLIATCAGYEVETGL